MGEDPEQDLPALGVGTTGGQGSPESTLQARADALRLPPLSIEVAREVPPQRAAGTCQGPSAARVAPIERDHGLGNAARLATEAMVVVRIVAGVAPQARGSQPLRRRARGGRARRRVLARAAGDDRAGDQVAGGLAHGSELRPVPASTPAQGPAPVDDVGADGGRLEAARVDRHHRGRPNQPRAVRAAEAGGLELNAGPLLRSRCSAPQSVESCGTVLRPSAPCSFVHSVTRVTRPRESVLRNCLRASRAKSCAGGESCWENRLESAGTARAPTASASRARRTADFVITRLGHLRALRLEGAADGGPATQDFNRAKGALSESRFTERFLAFLLPLPTPSDKALGGHTRHRQQPEKPMDGKPWARPCVEWAPRKDDRFPVSLRLPRSISPSTPLNPFQTATDQTPTPSRLLKMG